MYRFSGNRSGLTRTLLDIFRYMLLLYFLVEIFRNGLHIGCQLQGQARLAWISSRPQYPNQRLYGTDREYPGRTRLVGPTCPDRQQWNRACVRGCAGSAVLRCRILMISCAPFNFRSIFVGGKVVPYQLAAVRMESPVSSAFASSS